MLMVVFLLVAGTEQSNSELYQVNLSVMVMAMLLGKDCMLEGPLGLGDTSLTFYDFLCSLLSLPTLFLKASARVIPSIWFSYSRGIYIFTGGLTGYLFTTGASFFYSGFVLPFLFFLKSLALFPTYLLQRVSVTLLLMLLLCFVDYIFQLYSLLQLGVFQFSNVIYWRTASWWSICLTSFSGFFTALVLRLCLTALVWWLCLVVTEKVSRDCRLVLQVKMGSSTLGSRLMVCETVLPDLELDFQLVSLHSCLWQRLFYNILIFISFSIKSRLMPSAGVFMMLLMMIGASFCYFLGEASLWGTNCWVTDAFVLSFSIMFSNFSMIYLLKLSEGATGEATT